MSNSAGSLGKGIALRLGRLSLLRTRRAMVAVPPAVAPPISSVTIIVPARNEERGIEACVRSLVDQSYANYDVVVVDDGSEDATPAILQRLAAESPRLRVMRAPSLPPGWVGQTWAWQTGAGQATGEWLLFTDADTEHEPGMLAAVIAFAESRGLDMLSLITAQTLGSWGERIVLPAIFIVSLQTGGSLEEANDPQSPVAMANGQFILIRRAVYETAGGFGMIRGEVLNDGALARLIKGHGYRIMLADGRHWVRTRMYHSLGEIWRGFSKNAFFAVKQSLARVLVGAALLLGLSLGPFVLAGLAVTWLVTGTGNFWAWLALLFGGLGIVWQMVRGVGMAYSMRISLGYGLLHPLGLIILAGILLNSAFLILSGRGVTWKGRGYHGQRATAERSAPDR